MSEGSTSAPANPEWVDLCAGETVYYNGPVMRRPNDKVLIHGQQGKVLGPATDAAVPRLFVKVQFPDHEGGINIPKIELTREPTPPLPGGYSLGDNVHFLCHSQTMKNGERIVHGGQGEVVGGGGHPGPAGGYPRRRCAARRTLSPS